MLPVSYYTHKILLPFMKHHIWLEAQILRLWPIIVGSPYDECTYPQRVSCKEHRGLVVLNALPGAALSVQYNSAILKARINSFFGSDIIHQIIVKPKDITHILAAQQTATQPAPAASEPTPLTLSEDSPYAVKAEMVNEPELRRLLASIGYQLALQEAEQLNPSRQSHETSST